jgi:hypothetical protein
MKAMRHERLSPLRGSSIFSDAVPRADALGYILSAPFGGSKSDAFELNLWRVT